MKRIRNFCLECRWALLCLAQVVLLPLFSSCAMIFDVNTSVIIAEPKITAPPIDSNPNVTPPFNLSKYPYKGSTAAILTFKAISGVSESEIMAFTDAFEGKFIEKNVQRIVNRAKMKQILELQKFSATCGSTECAMEAGQLLNVEYMIYGSVERKNQKSIITVFLTSVESGQQLACASFDYNGTRLTTEGAEQTVNCFLHAVMRKTSKP